MKVIFNCKYYDFHKDYCINIHNELLKRGYESIISTNEEYYEDGIEEVSMTGGGAASQATFTPGIGGQYATPYAFRLKGQKPNDKAYKELGYKPVNEKELTKSEKNKLKKVSSQLKKSVKAHDKQAKTIDKAIRNEAYGDGADLGPGPKASEDGVNDNYYVN